jgi:hypothetical protein
MAARCRLEVDPGFARFDVAQLFPNDALDRPLISLERANGSVQLPAALFLLAQLRLLAKDLLPHVLILLDEGQVPDAYCNDGGYKQQQDDETTQLFPDAKVDVHSR